MENCKFLPSNVKRWYFSIKKNDIVMIDSGGDSQYLYYLGRIAVVSRSKRWFKVQW